MRSDVCLGPDGESRWLEVAPAGSVARLALIAPMRGSPGGAAIGIDLDQAPEQVQGAPMMFSLRDPDGNYVGVVSAD